jgi:hypothetical protein
MRLPNGSVKYMLEDHNVTIYPTTHVLLIINAIYGLVQAARQWWKKVIEVMAKCDYYPSKSDPCQFIKQAEHAEPISFFNINVDDSGTIGTPDAIKEVIALLVQVVKVKSIGLHIIDTIDKDGVWIYQPNFLKHLLKHSKNILGD